MSWEQIRARMNVLELVTAKKREKKLKQIVDEKKACRSYSNLNVRDNERRTITIVGEQKKSKEKV